MGNTFKIKFIDCTETDLKQVGFDKTHSKKGLDKHQFKTIKIYNLTCAQANILKQTALSTGTDCAVHREVITGKVELSHCILSGTLSQFKKIIEKLKFQPLKLSELAETVKSLLFAEKKQLLIRDNLIKWSDKTLIMGILNITPDSFSDGGEFFPSTEAIEHFKQMVNDGADIIDIGGESTRPFAKRVSVEEEIQRVIPIIKEIRKFDKKTIISVDTRNSITAQIAIEAGADIINDISSGDWDENIFTVVKEKNCPIILNHSKGTPDVMQNDTNYKDVVDEIYDYFTKKIDELEKVGVEKSKIILDPGIGFGKTKEQNFELIKRVEEFYSLGCPVLVGHSRKTFLKETINTDENAQLDRATAIVSQKLADKNVNIIRVHNVKEHKMLLELRDLLI